MGLLYYTNFQSQPGSNWLSWPIKQNNSVCFMDVVLIFGVVGAALVVTLFQELIAQDLHQTESTFNILTKTAAFIISFFTRWSLKTLA